MEARISELPENQIHEKYHITGVAINARIKAKIGLEPEANWSLDYNNT